MSEYQIRQPVGATLALDLQFTDDFGAPADVSGAALSCVMADALGNVLATPTIALASGLGWATISQGTAGWPAGIISAQLTVTAAGVVAISEAFPITMVGAL